MTGSRLIIPTLDDEPWPSLGGQVCAFIEEKLVHGPGDVLGEPVTLTDEVRAFIWRAYEVFPRGHPQAGRRRFKRAVLSRRKGFGKTEDAAWLAIVEMDPNGPVRCDGWDADGNPVGRSVRDPYIPMIAVTEGQAEDLAYGAVYAILSNDNCDLVDDYDLGIEKVGRPPERITHRHEPGKIQALASAPSTRDGARTTFEHFDETHLFDTERLVAVHTTMLRNLPKRRAADPWGLETTTMYAPGEKSVAEGSHEYALKVVRGKVDDPRLLFDHRQADEKWDLEDPEQLVAAIAEASGDAIAYADVPAITSQYYDPQADEADFRRFWLNQPRRTTRKWFAAGQWERLVASEHGKDDDIVLSLFGSYDRGSTVLVGATVDERPHVFVVKTWERPSSAARGWRVPVRDVIDTVEAVMSDYHVREYAPNPIGWRREVEDWEDTYGDVVVRFETNKTSIWGPACDEFYQAVCDGALTHDGDSVMADHIAAATLAIRSGYTVLAAPAPSATGAAVVAHSRARWHVNNSRGLVPLAAVT